MNSAYSPPQRILVPLDFTGSTKEPLLYAAALAGKSGTTITLLHVVPRNDEGDQQGILRRRLIHELADEAQTRLQVLVKRLWEGELTTVFRLHAGHPHEEIAACARTIRADLIVMATRGHAGGLRRWLGWSTLARVSRRAPCPVLVVWMRDHGSERTGDGLNAAPQRCTTPSAAAVP